MVLLAVMLIVGLLKRYHVPHGKPAYPLGRAIGPSLSHCTIALWRQNPRPVVLATLLTGMSVTAQETLLFTCKEGKLDGKVSIRSSNECNRARRLTENPVSK